MAEFEATFASLSRFAPELMATKERRCIKFETRLRDALAYCVGGSMMREYNLLIEAAAYMETQLGAGEKKMRGFRQRGQKIQGETQHNKRQKGFTPQQSHGAQSRSTFPVPSSGVGGGGQGGFSCFKCGQLGHKSFSCP
ncbi:uncharacterized protein LOC114318781 [Camellia sinensis]|uniref:uncharacterized protein LOC114318781 n=1 Tax=Camellia sinensis TaxID=4442 RepID=UPI00103651D7|nr:uncharacterized protein LOC114318781 [Camellia sinensis]